MEIGDSYPGLNILSNVKLDLNEELDFSKDLSNFSNLKSATIRAKILFWTHASEY